MALASWEVWRFGGQWTSDSGAIELDTTPPVGVLNLITATAGQNARVGYVLNEPAAIAAVLHLADGRDLPMLVTGSASGELACDLPADAPSSAEVRLLVRDDLDNEQTLLLAIPIEGTIAQVPQPTGGLPGREFTGARLLRMRSRARARLRTHQRAALVAARVTLRLRLDSFTTTQAPPSRPVPVPVPQPHDRVLSTTVQIPVRITSRTTALMGTMTYAITYGRIVTRRDLPPAVLEALDLV